MGRRDLKYDVRRFKYLCHRRFIYYRLQLMWAGWSPSRSYFTYYFFFPLVTGNLPGEGIRRWCFEWNMFHTVISTVRFGENSIASEIRVRLGFYLFFKTLLGVSWNSNHFNYCGSFFRSSNGMLYTFYSVARREHVVGLWRGLVPVSMSRMLLRECLDRQKFVALTRWSSISTCVFSLQFSHFSYVIWTVFSLFWKTLKFVISNFLVLFQNY